MSTAQNRVTRRVGPCSGKNFFDTEERARVHLVHVQSERAAEAVKVERSAYHCRFCGGWHLTSRRPRSVPRSVAVLDGEALRRNVELIRNYWAGR